MAIKNVVNSSLILHNGLAADWASKNPILLKGELGAEIDTGLLKLGDGVTHYNDLAYINVTPAQIIEELAAKVDTTGGTVTGALTLNYEPSASTDAVSKGYVDNLIMSAGSLKREIVTILPPVAEADINTIYMIKDTQSFGPDFYKEYIIINGEFALIGDTSVNLTNYIQKPVSFTEGNLVSFDINGNIIDSGVAANNISVSTNVNDLIQTPGDELILYCGTSELVI